MFHAGQITRKYLASPTVMILELSVPSLKEFNPGQWVDFVVPPHDFVGGFSIASSPDDLPKLTLAVKKSNANASTWVHTGKDAVVGTQLKVKVGGNCTLTNVDIQRPIVFCAGGIGISPVLGNYREYLKKRRQQHNPSSSRSQKSMFLYSISKQDEMVFADELVQLHHSSQDRDSDSTLQDDRMVFTLTSKEEEWDNESLQKRFGKNNMDKIELRKGRYLRQFLDDSPCPKDDAIYYICGPQSLNDEAVAYLENKGVSSENLRFEKWW